MSIWNNEQEEAKGRSKMADPTKDASTRTRNATPTDSGSKAQMSNQSDLEDNKTNKDNKENRDRESVSKIERGTSPSAISSPTQEEADKAAENLVRKTEEKDGVKTIISSVGEDEANKAKETAGRLPKTENLTQSLTGSVGNIDLTQGGTLAGDKSVREDKTIDEINEELNEKAGPNPMPNRDGNEYTNLTNRLTPTAISDVSRLDRDTTGMAAELKSIRESGNLSEDQKKKLENMEKRLQKAGKV